MKSAVQAARMARRSVVMSVPFRDESRSAPSSSARARMRHAERQPSSAEPGCTSLMGGRLMGRIPSPAARCSARAMSFSGVPDKRGMNPVTGRSGSDFFNTWASRLEKALSSRFRHAEPQPVFRMKSAVPLRSTCRVCQSGAGSGPVSSAGISPGMTAASRSKSRSLAASSPVPDHRDEAPGSINGPSPPARRTVATGRAVSSARRRLSSSSCSSCPSCQGAAGMRRSRHGLKDGRSFCSPTGRTVNSPDSFPRNRPTAGAEFFSWHSPGMTAFWGRRRPKRSR